MVKLTRTVLFLSLILFLCSIPNAHAAMVTCLGIPDSSGDCPIEIDDSDNIRIREKAEVFVTNDTLTADESGLIALSNRPGGSPIVLTLPTSAAGLTYSFVTMAGNAAVTTAGWGRTYLKPQSTDVFVGCVNGSITTTFASGDSLYSPGATGDSLTIIGADNTWYCVNRIGTWVDGN